MINEEHLKLLHLCHLFVFLICLLVLRELYEFLSDTPAAAL